MKKRIYIITTIFTILVLFISSIVWFFCDTSLQTNLVNAILDKSGIKISKVNIGTNTIVAENLYAKLSTGTFTADSIIFDYSFSNLFSKNLKGSGEIKNAKFVLSKEKTNSENSSKNISKTNALSDIKAELKLPINLDISSFKGNIDIENGSNCISTYLQLTNVKINNQQLDFELNATTKVQQTSNTNYTLYVKKLGKVCNAKFLHNQTEIALATAEISENLSGNIKVKLTLNKDTLSPISKQFNLYLPNLNAQAYVEANFDLPANAYTINLMSKADISELQQNKFTKDLPFTKCEFLCTAKASIKNNKLSITELSTSLNTNNAPIFSFDCPNPINTNFCNLKDFDWLSIGTLSVSLPSEFIDKKIAGEFSAKGINAIFDVSINKNFSVKIKSTKPATVKDALYIKDKQTIFENLTLFSDIEGTANIKENSFSAKAKLYTQIVSNKKLTIDVNAQYVNKRSTIELKAEGSLKHLASCLKVIDYPLKDDILLDANLQATYNNQLEISKLNAKAMCINSDTPLEICAYDKILFNPQKREFIKPCSVKIRTKDFPFSIFLPFTNGVDAQSVSLDSTAMLDNKKISIQGTLTLNDVSYVQNQQTDFHDINLDTIFSASLDIQNLQLIANANKIKLSNSATEFCTATANLNASFPQKTLKLNSLKASASLQLAPIFAMPMLAKYNNIDRASLDANVEINSQEKLNANLKISNFASRSTSKAIETMSANVVADIPSFKNIEAHINAKSERGTTNATIKFEKSQTITAEINAKSIIADDILILKSAFSNPLYIETKNPQAKRKIRRPDEAFSVRKNLPELKTKDLKAFWNINTNALIKFNVGNLKFQESTPLENFSTNITITNTQLELTNLSAKILDGTLKGGLKITFDETLNNPYKIEQTSFLLEKFDISKISTKEFLKGIFTAKISLQSEGINLEHLTKYATGSAVIEGGKGSLLLIDKNSNIGKKIGLAQSAVSLLNTFIGSKSIDNTTKLIDKFERINFDTAKFKLSRNNKDFNINLDTAEILAPDFLLKSLSGTIYFDALKPIIEHDIEIVLAIYSNNEQLLKMLGSVNALDIKSDITDMRKSEDFKILGTIEKPQTNIIDILTNKATSNATQKKLRNIKIF